MTAPRKVLTFYEAVELRKLAVHAIEAHGDAIRAASTDGEDVEAASAASTEATRQLHHWINVHTDYTTPETDVS
ncbi:hypothetical protein [Actinopolymorpha pittospori]|uniref:Uncharacterized protein n=1 Tax=Actinopolymorpha pittospori TaxID=648752 RepID=A0A927MX09_9ACTN|nr:hypothetical protein [Actinopolymorpha pittospori]MBE1608169.1 hypothetical protein [Actinopolymorpha pittospori]